MSFYITAMNALDTKDYQAIEGLMHEDFIWMNGYEMKTLDEWLEGLRVAHCTCLSDSIPYRY